MTKNVCKTTVARWLAALAVSASLASSACAQTVLFDFGNDESFRGLSVNNPDANGNYWNSFRTGAFYQDLVDIGNNATTIDFGFSTGVATDSYNGPAGATDTATLLTDVTFTDIEAVDLGLLGGANEAAFDYVAGPTGPPSYVRFEVQQLDPAKTYDLTFFASRKFTTDYQTVFNVYSDNTYTTLVDSVTLAHRDEFDPFLHNRDTVATISGLSPQASNILYVEFVGDQGNPGYLNAMQLTGSGGVTPTTTISDFGNFTLGGTYGSWDSATLTSGADAFTVESSGFGGGFASVPANFDPTDNTHIELDVTIDGGDAPHVIALLQDADGTQAAYRWFSLAAGDHTLGFRLGTLTNAEAGEAPNGIDGANSYPGDAGSIPGLDLSNLTAFQIQIDPHGSAFPYDITFDNLRVKNVPGGFDTDEDSDGRDFLVWQRGLTPDPLSSADLAEWQSNYGSTGTAAAGAVHSIPEPTAIALALLGGLSLAGMRSKRARM